MTLARLDLNKRNLTWHYENNKDPETNRHIHLNLFDAGRRSTATSAFWPSATTAIVVNNRIDTIIARALVHHPVSLIVVVLLLVDDDNIVIVKLDFGLAVRAPVRRAIHQRLEPLQLCFHRLELGQLVALLAVRSSAVWTLETKRLFVIIEKCEMKFCFLELLWALVILKNLKFNKSNTSIKILIFLKNNNILKLDVDKLVYKIGS